MTYQQTTDWLFAQLPNFQQQGPRALFKNLDNIFHFCDYLGHPQNNFPCIHVAGTNGKGSTSHMISSVLQSAGFKVGLYTSPHLKDFRERIKINGIPVEELEVVDFVNSHISYLNEERLSFFEMTVAMAFTTFAKHHVDIAIIEVGLGGRLDATNIINPILSVITNIGRDHMGFLGTTLPEIALEKAGIIKPHVPVVIGEYCSETIAVFDAEADKIGAEIIAVPDLVVPTYECDLKGMYQLFNLRTATAAILELKRQGWTIPEQAMEQGFGHVVANTQLLGRWQKLSHRPDVFCDVAHNVDGIRVLVQHIQTLVFGQLHLVFGVMKDKDLDSILPLLPKGAHYYCCQANGERALTSDVLSSVLSSKGFESQSYGAVSSALQAAQSAANTDDLIVICGSNFVVAEII
mgnify:CR=1 FL=1|jgi:dihydrofolate synthase / folylpolyglutamate synthase